ncbi:MAG: response regulator [Candidatus Omnitrophica bacterium]|nr:response regulator [Candidatus Omnitrophota bacterium]
MSEGNKPHVLLIDDEQVVRELLQKFLERNGYAVFTACDGVDALQVVKARNIGIIISDIVMPRMDGLEFLKHLRKFNKQAQVIMITGQPSLGGCVESIVEASCEYLIKPIEREDILRCVQNAEKQLENRSNKLQDYLNEADCPPSEENTEDPPV